MLKIILLIVIVLPCALAITTRLWPIDAERFHIDPLKDGVAGNEGGFYLSPIDGDIVAPVYYIGTTELAQKLDAILKVDGTPIAGNIYDSYATFLFRSKAFGFPDYLSIRVIDIDGKSSTLAIYSRLRFGRSDLGVNRKRVENILEQLDDQTRNN